MSKKNQTEDFREEADDYKVGYGKPPKTSQFKKGVSGNPLGRSKKPSDFASQLKKELDSKLIINEKGQRKVMNKSQLVAKQLVNKAASGSVQATRLLVSLKQQADQRAAEQQQSSPKKTNNEYRKADDYSDDELALIIQGIDPEYSKK
jgi:Family of unknown function (DUF5681)